MHCLRCGGTECLRCGGIYRLQRGGDYWLRRSAAEEALGSFALLRPIDARIIGYRTPCKRARFGDSTHCALRDHQVRVPVGNRPAILSSCPLVVPFTGCGPVPERAAPACDPALGRCRSRHTSRTTSLSTRRRCRPNAVSRALSHSTLMVLGMPPDASLTATSAS